MYPSGQVSFGQSLLPSPEISTNKYVIKNLSLTLTTIAKSTAKAMVGQQTSLNSVANGVLDNRIVFDYLLAEKGDVCATVKTFYCTWTNTSGFVEIQIQEINEQATQLEQVDTSSGTSFDLGGSN